MNKITELAGLGGAYHVGVEILSLEWSFGWSPEGTGVHNVYAGCSESGIFKERVVLGQTSCTPHAILDILGALREEWSGSSYHLLKRNCAHFSMELVQRLRVREFPEWVNSLSSLILWLTDWVDTPSAKAPMGATSICSSSLTTADATEAAVASELDWKEAQEYMLERAADAILARRRRIRGRSQTKI
jgi:hypothetical protein